MNGGPGRAQEKRKNYPNESPVQLDGQPTEQKVPVPHIGGQRYKAYLSFAYIF